ncbi:MAG: hypothetical protein QOJ72_1426 [Nocardioidaceae bacterium]|nr:hypothetical protein [Nocardioidaceae bacterium]
MRRLLVLLAGLVALLGVLVAVSSLSSQSSATAAPPSSLQTAQMPAVSAPPVKAPRPRFTRTMYAATQMAGAPVMLDACHGPIAVRLGAGRPVLVVQHDYCGGLAWMPKLNYGDAVKLKGDGIDPGTYVVTEIRFQIRKEATVGDLPNADAVLQTCVTKHKLILVGLDWVGA